MNPSLIIFDIDKTLTKSKAPMELAMTEQFTKLLAKKRVAVISGDSLSIIERDVISLLPENAKLENLFILPTSGAALYEWKENEWHKVYTEEIIREEVARIEDAIKKACDETRIIDLSSQSYGERIEYRGAEVTLSALGQEAPIAEKEAWDASGEKKLTLRNAIAKLLPEYDVKTGGSTSIDITKTGINKEYGVERLADYLSIPISEMLYVGDALYPQGNDEVVKESGIATHQVANPEETLAFISSLL